MYISVCCGYLVTRRSTRNCLQLVVSHDCSQKESLILISEGHSRNHMREEVMAYFSEWHRN